jgi:cyclopropane-fatty-acyl-phospholipid synthase
MLLQTITINERTFPSYRRRADWIQKFIFPGSELASGSEILRSLARVTTLSLHYAEDIGTHYARTLASWRDRFHHALPEVRALGFDERFIRMWDYYLAYCEAAFLERHIGDIQLLLTKSTNRNTLFNEPWDYSSVANSSVALQN